MDDGRIVEDRELVAAASWAEDSGPAASTRAPASWWAMSSRAFGHPVRTGLRGRRPVGTLLFVAVVTLVGGLRHRHRQSRGRRSPAGRRLRRRLGPHVTLRASMPRRWRRRVGARRRRPVRRGKNNVVDGVLVVRRGRRGRVRGATAPVPSGVGALYVVEGRLARERRRDRRRAELRGRPWYRARRRHLARHGSTTASFAVVGTVLDFNDCFYPQCDPGVVWTAPTGRRVRPRGSLADGLPPLFRPDSAPSFVTACCVITAIADRQSGLARYAG